MGSASTEQETEYSMKFCEKLRRGNPGTQKLVRNLAMFGDRKNVLNLFNNVWKYGNINARLGYVAGNNYALESAQNQCRCHSFIN